MATKYYRVPNNRQSPAPPVLPGSGDTEMEKNIFIRIYQAISYGYQQGSVFARSRLHICKPTNKQRNEGCHGPNDN